MTDIPSMKLTKVNGGHSIAVYQSDRSVADRMLIDGRADYAVKANYSKGSEMEKTAFEIIDQIAATSKTLERHFSHIDRTR